MNLPLLIDSHRTAELSSCAHSQLLHQRVISVYSAIIFLDVNEVFPLSVEVFPQSEMGGGRCYQFQKQVETKKPELSVTSRQRGQLCLVAEQVCVVKTE